MGLFDSLQTIKVDPATVSPATSETVDTLTFYVNQKANQTAMTSYVRFRFYTGVNSAPTGSNDALASASLISATDSVFAVSLSATGASATTSSFTITGLNLVLPASTFGVRETIYSDAAATTLSTSTRVALSPGSPAVGTALAYTFVDGIPQAGVVDGKFLQNEESSSIDFSDFVTPVPLDIKLSLGGSVPEPTSLAMIGLGMTGLLGRRRRA